MKSILIFFSILVSTYCLAQHKEGVDSNFHLYLLVGQSNMAGRGALDSLSKEINPRIWMLDKNNKWVLATDPIHFDKPDVAGVGPGIAFAKEMLKDNKNISIGLIPCAWGGSSIKVWQPDSPYINNSHPYDDAIKRTENAMKYGVLKGILWHQGEADSNKEGVEGYMARVTELIQRFRTAFNNPQLPFVAGEIGYFGKSTAINKVLDQIPNKVPFTYTVSAKGLTDNGDKLHFNTTSARELGRRYALGYEKVLVQSNGVR